MPSRATRRGWDGTAHRPGLEPELRGGVGAARLGGDKIEDTLRARGQRIPRGHLAEL